MTLGVQLKERATFESFLTGRNQELVAHLKHVVAATPPGATWLAGPHAAGKSHLLQAVCAGLAPGKRAAYLPLETLLPFGPGTLDGVETLDVACYDDVQVIAGLEQWEERLFSLWQRALERDSHAAVRGARESGARRFRAAGPQVPAGILGGVRGARTQRRRAARGADAARAAARPGDAAGDRAATCSGDFRATCARLCDILDTLDDAAFVAQRRLTVPFIRDVIEGRAACA